MPELWTVGEVRQFMCDWLFQKVHSSLLKDNHSLHQICTLQVDRKLSEILWQLKGTADCSSFGVLPGFEQAIGVKWLVGKGFPYPTVSREKGTCTKCPWRDTNIFLSCRFFPTQHDGVHIKRRKHAR